jgi:pimeloyl-ACP methyl ester carboxylesterase
MSGSSFTLKAHNASREEPTMSRTEPQMLDRGEGCIAYDVAGAGPLVLCVPGMGELRSSYRYNVTALVESGYRVATVDLRGHGDSDATFSSYDDLATASDLEALVEHLGGPAIVIGNSMGAAAAVLAAASRPDLVAGLVLVGPFVRDAPTNAFAKLALRLAMAGPWARASWASYLSKLYPGRRPADFAEHRSLIVETMRQPGHTRAFSETTRTSHGQAEERLSEVKSPVLVVMGDRDPDFSDPAAEAEWISRRLSGQILVVPGAGHYPQAEYPELVNPALIEFTQRVLSA